MDKKPANKFSHFSKKELDAFFSAAKTVKKNASFTILIAKSNNKFGRILIIASRKYGNAPTRNLLKRRLKAIFWEEKLYLKKIDCAVIARPAGKEYDFATLKKMVLEIFASH